MSQMKLQLFKSDQHPLHRGAFRTTFVVEAPEQIVEQFDQLVGFSKPDVGISIVVGYIYNHYNCHWCGPYKLIKLELKECSRLEFLVQEGRGFEASLPDFLGKLNEA